MANKLHSPGEFDDVPLPDMEQAWLKMKELLDKKDNNKKPLPFILRTWTGWGLVLLLLGGAVWFISNGGFQKKDIAVHSASGKGQESNENSNTQNSSTGKSETVTSTSPENNTALIDNTTGEPVSTVVKENTPNQKTIPYKTQTATTPTTESRSVQNDKPSLEPVTTPQPNIRDQQYAGSGNNSQAETNQQSSPSSRNRKTKKTDTRSNIAQREGQLYSDDPQNKSSLPYVNSAKNDKEKKRITEESKEKISIGIAGQATDSANQVDKGADMSVQLKHKDTAGTRPETELAKADIWDPLESTCRHASLSIL